MGHPVFILIRAFNLKANCFQKYADYLFKIKKTHTAPYHPQSDGMVERFSKTLAYMLLAYVDEHHNDWDEHLPYVMMAYRSTVHETTCTIPNIMMLDREVATPLDFGYEM